MTSRLTGPALAAVLVLLGAGRIEAQVAASQACYVPASGTVYVIGLDGAPSGT